MITLEFKPVVFDKEVVSPYPSDTTKNILLRQPVISWYGSSNSTKDSLFGDKGTAFPSSRTVILRVPIGKSVADIQNALTATNARIWKHTSNTPIITEEIASAINAGRTTLEKVTEGQRSKIYGSDGVTLIPVVDRRNGKPVFHIHGFSTSNVPHEDVDDREYSAIEEAVFAEKVAAESALKREKAAQAV